MYISLPLSLSLSLSPSLQVPLSVDSVNPSPAVSVSAASDDSDIVAQEATEDLEDTINEVYTTVQYTVCVQCIVVNKGYHTV